MLVILFYDITDTNKQLYRQVKKISERYLYREAEVVGWNNGNNIPKISKNSSRNVNPARYSFDENIDDDFNFESQTVSNNSNRKKYLQLRRVCQFDKLIKNCLFVQISNIMRIVHILMRLMANGILNILEESSKIHFMSFCMTIFPIIL